MNHDEADSYELRLRQLRNEIERLQIELDIERTSNLRYRKAIDNIYNFNAAARTAVVKCFGTLHPPARKEVTAPDAANQRLVDEVARLGIENAELRIQLTQLRTDFANVRATHTTLRRAK